MLQFKTGVTAYIFIKQILPVKINEMSDSNEQMKQNHMWKK